MDTLKKRAERFGGSTSNTLKKMEVDEAIKRRQERFGVVDKNEPKVRRMNRGYTIKRIPIFSEKRPKSDYFLKQ